MKKIFTLFVVALFSVMSWATIGAPASIDFGAYNIFGETEVTDSVELTLNPVGVSDWGISAEVINDAEGIFYTSHSWLYEDGTADYYHVEKAKVYFYAIEEGEFTATLRLTDCQTNEYEDVALSVKVVNQATGIDAIKEDKVQSSKELRDGKLIIRRNGESYSIDGKLTR